MKAFLDCLSGVEFYRTVRDGRDVVCVRLPETVIESIGGEWYDYLCFHFEGGKVVRITSEEGVQLL